MPIYEYICEACDHEFEELQKFSDPPPKKCPSCGKGKPKKLVSKSSFVLKGSGWYVTDYGKGGQKPRKESESSESKSSDTKSSDGDKKSGDKKASDKKSSGKAAD